jgi:hypothetical protein
MNDLAKALPHLIMATIVIAAVVALAVANKLTGTEVLPVIAAAGGFTMGGTVASGSISTTSDVIAEASPSILPPAGSETATPATTPPGTPPTP